MKHLFWGLVWAVAAWAQAAEPVTIRFRAVVGAEDLACGKSYPGIGTTKSAITPRDFRFYVHNVRLVDAAGREVPVQLEQDEKWQFDDIDLLNCEDATGSCGVPFEKKHTDLTKMTSPLNLTALARVWNAGREFARLDFSSTGAPHGYAIHLGSTGCTPNETKTSIPTSCSAPNRAEGNLPAFNAAQDTLVADLAALLADSHVDLAGKMMSGCMSGPKTEACGPLFANLGLPLGEAPAGQQKLFRRQAGAAPASSARR